MRDERSRKDPNVGLALSPAKNREATMRDLTFHVQSDHDIVNARQKGRELAAELGFSPSDLTLIATSISELARNIILYAKRGDFDLGKFGPGSPWGSASDG